jgi:predicted RNA-binding Zn ribbon-like protein
MLTRDGRAVDGRRECGEEGVIASTDSSRLVAVDDVEVRDVVVALNEEAIVCVVEDSALDIVAREAANRVSRLPEGDDEELRFPVDDPPEAERAEVTRGLAERTEAGLVEVAQVRFGVFRFRCPPPGASDHIRHRYSREYWCYIRGVHEPVKGQILVLRFMPMRTAPTPRSSSPELPLKYVGGDPSIDLVNTVDWLGDELDHDRIPDYDRLTRWAEGAGVITASVGERLRRASEAHPRQAAAAVAAAGWLRWVLQRLFTAVASGEPPGVALDELNELLTDGLGRMRVAPSSRRQLALAWQRMGEDLESPLWPVVWSAAQLLTSNEAARIHICAAPDCGWMYVDRSRNRLRRWCQMETCGTRAKSRRRYERERRS